MNAETPTPPPSAGFSLRRWDHCLALGFGSGLAPWAPGTVGSVVATIVHWLVLGHLAVAWQILIVVVGFALGVWVCERLDRDLGRHDDGAIVWDEFIGVWIALVPAAGSLFLTLVGFGLFRMFDIWKPWPIRWLDRHVAGGFGVMIDDVAAGVAAAAILALIGYGMMQV